MKFEISAVNQDRKIWLWVLFGLAIPLIVCTVRAVPFVLDPGVPYDTQYSYLPLARMVLENFGSLWHDELMLKTAPGAYFYMALMNANMDNIKMGNLVMTMGITIMLFDALRRTAGWGAAALAAWLFALSPTLLVWTMYPMGEPIFLFLVTAWLWACVWAIHLAPSSHGLRWLAITIGGLALAAATLTRGTYMYGIPAAVLCFGLLAWRRPMESFWRPLAFIHLIALVLVGSFVVRTHIEFGKPVIAAGAGNALYYGMNPIYRGEEPPLFGAGFDEFYILGTADQLSLEADERQVAAVKQIIHDTPWPQLTSMVLHKAEVLLFYSTAHLRNYKERAWRIALLCFGLAGVWLTRRNPITWFLAGVFVYQWLVHIPALYTPRYSIAALDLPLSLLAALGGWAAWCRFGKKGFLGLLALTAAAILAGAYHQRYSAKLLPDLSSAEVRPVAHAAPADLEVSGLNQSPLKQPAHSAEGRFTIEWQTEQANLAGQMLLKIDNLAIDRSCKRLWIATINPEGVIFEIMVPLKGLRSGNDFIWGFGHLYDKGPLSTIRLTFDCKPNVNIQFDQLGIAQVSTAHRYRDRQIYK